jgi:fumarate reductase flavoprotein subunit
VLEKGSANKYLCNTRYTGGTSHVCISGDVARSDLTRAVAKDAERAVRWPPRRGCKFPKTRASPHHRWVLAPLGQTRLGLDWEGRAGDVLLRHLSDNLEDHGGKLQRGVGATRLVLEDEPCVEVVAKVESKEIEHLAKFIMPVPSKLLQLNAESGTGDGLRMAAATGTDLRGMDRFYSHLLSIDAPHQERLWPYP